MGCLYLLPFIFILTRPGLRAVHVNCEVLLPSSLYPHTYSATQQVLYSSCTLMPTLFVKTGS